ncbi:MAG TPA: efflux RND transporter permease subunit [Thermoanaerobaculia bacterium]|jgi:multidrug efflux pump subunit AcrB|nr:efflux RND transporter permease subunit [Thermoanaerobaculia bacterium]
MHSNDDQMIAKTKNTARFFTEQRHISWVLLIGVVLWGIYGYMKMPKRKDPEVPVRLAVALTPWPGASAEKVEDLVTRKLEAKMAENAKVKKIESISRTGLSVVYVELVEGLKDTSRELDDIRLKLDEAGRTLPEGAGPVQFVKDFGDTEALMLTVASPKADDIEISLRAKQIQAAIEKTRAGAAGRVTVLACVPQSVDIRATARTLEKYARTIEQNGIGRDVRPINGSGFAALDFETSLDEAKVLQLAKDINDRHLPEAERHPDLWEPIVVRDPAQTRERLAAVAGDKYSYRDLEKYTELIQRTLQTVPQVSKVSRSGILPERVFVDYSQEKLAGFGVQGPSIEQLLGARNIMMPGGVLQVGDKNLVLDPSGEFKSEKEIGNVIVGNSEKGAPVYLRDLVDIHRSYQTPARYLNYFTWRDDKGNWHRSRAITIAVQMRSGEQIAGFGKAVDASLNDVRHRLPKDLVVARTSDQPLQVEESLDLFMKSLYEAIFLVVLVALIGFWEWRSALLMALSIPITLAMTFGMMMVLGVDLQQVSVASLIIALGLLVDDPVVAGDAIKRALNEGKSPLVAAWLGPTKLATAILFATITNIVAYLPLLMIEGDTGKFIYTLPVVLTCALVASRLVSMAFIPLLGYYLLRRNAKQEVSRAELRTRGFFGWYSRLGSWAIDHRWRVLAMSLVFIAGGAFLATKLKSSFFPKDYSYLSYVDIWLPEDAPLAATNRAARKSEEVIRRVAAEYGKEHEKTDVLERLTTFVGGGGPRFWFTVAPELQQLNYAQIVVQVKDKHDTGELVPRLQKALSAEVPGARIDARQLDMAAVGIPVAVRVSGNDIAVLRQNAEELKKIFRSIPQAQRVRDDWGDESMMLRLDIDSDRANFAGITNYDVAASSSSAINGRAVTQLRDGNDLIPVVVRLRPEERARMSDVQGLYVVSEKGTRVPLGQVSKIDYGMETEKLRRRNQFRTITVSAFPAEGVLPSEVMNAARARIEALQKNLPPGYRLEIGGEEEEQKKGFANMTMVMLISILMIYLALVLQFRNAIKPVIVFAAIPYGIIGALICLVIVGVPFGFMAFLGVASLIGVIVSHVIVLFDFIEEMQAEGAPLREALIDAGIVRLRPVLITVGATVLGLFPLASHGGPLWEPLCYAQIGGLIIATAITLLMVPVIYAICVLDLRIVKWPGVEKKEETCDSPTSMPLVQQTSA